MEREVSSFRIQSEADIRWRWLNLWLRKLESFIESMCTDLMDYL